MEILLQFIDPLFAIPLYIILYGLQHLYTCQGLGMVVITDTKAGVLRTQLCYLLSDQEDILLWLPLHLTSTPEKPEDGRRSSAVERNMASSMSVSLGVTKMFSNMKMQKSSIDPRGNKLQEDNALCLRDGKRTAQNPGRLAVPSMAQPTRSRRTKKGTRWVIWVPESDLLRSKMIYASSRDAIQKLTGVSKNYKQAEKSPTIVPAQVGTLTSPPPSLCDLDELPPLPAAFHSHICIPPPPTPLLLEVPPFLGRCWIVNSFRWTFLSNLEHSRAPRVLGVFAKEAPSLASSECPGEDGSPVVPSRKLLSFHATRSVAVALKRLSVWCTSPLKVTRYD
ncbi:hypothetical protein U0070_013598 [Myodes glareolus]|uniref:Uncharacterized protein n=1 Tax=Myodes glareolus TaxID=447135 RepID=A0AAW0JM01_MYOGA